jgi:hypothetical protein
VELQHSESTPTETPTADRATAGRVLLGAVVVGSLAAVIFGNGFGRGFAAGWLAVALGSYVALVFLGRRAALTRQLIWAGALLMVAASVLAPPRGSQDVASYAMYGRMVAEHHASPYTNTPFDFPHDKWASRVSRYWIDTPSVYGPVFTASSAVGMKAAGESFTFGRLWFQALAAISFIGILLLIERRTRDPQVLAFVALNPLLVVVAINGGHNDLLMALPVLAAVLFASDRRFEAAGVLAGLAALVKLTGGLALLGIAAWALFHYGRKEAARLMAWGLGTVAFGYLLVGGMSALRPLMAAGKTNQNSATLWSVPKRWFVDNYMSSGLNRIAAEGSATALLGRVAGLVLLLLVLAAVVSRRHVSSPALPVAAAFFAFLIVTPWLLPWYAVASVPLLAFHQDSRMSRVFTVWSSVFCVAYFHNDLPTGVGSWLGSMLYGVMPLANMAAVVGLGGYALVRLVEPYLQNDQLEVAQQPAFDA